MKISSGMGFRRWKSTSIGMELGTKTTCLGTSPWPPLSRRTASRFIKWVHWTHHTLAMGHLPSVSYPRLRVGHSCGQRPVQDWRLSAIRDRARIHHAAPGRRNILPAATHVDWFSASSFTTQRFHSTRSRIRSILTPSRYSAAHSWAFCDSVVPQAAGAVIPKRSSTPASRKWSSTSTGTPTLLTPLGCCPPTSGPVPCLAQRGSWAKALWLLREPVCHLHGATRDHGVHGDGRRALRGATNIQYRIHRNGGTGTCNLHHFILSEAAFELGEALIVGPTGGRGKVTGLLRPYAAPCEEGSTS